ncbi:hypothetical protein KJ966_06455 [bacterium]|nr:hypothetical protein [bacterium]
MGLHPRQHVIKGDHVGQPYHNLCFWCSICKQMLRDQLRENKRLKWKLYCYDRVTSFRMTYSFLMIGCFLYKPTPCH